MKYLKVIDGTKSNANGFEYKVNEVNIARTWNPSTYEPEKMGGFNFSVENKIIRYIMRGDTIYNVIVPKDAKIIECPSQNCPHGIFRSNKIILSNPRKITEDMVMNLYKKADLPDNTYYQLIVIMTFKKYMNVAKKIIKDRINRDNIDDCIKEFERFICDKHDGKVHVFRYAELWNEAKELYDILKEIESPLLISQTISKEPYTKKLTGDNIINLTGQTGSGKSTYAKKNFNTDNYIIIDTDDIFTEKRFSNSQGINKKLGEYFRNKYKELPNLHDNFDLIYKDILDYCKKYYNKIIVIDCAQFHEIKDLSILKGEFIYIRTCIDECYKRCLERFKTQNKSYSEEEYQKYAERKKIIYNWYKGSNEFLIKLNEL